MATELKIPHAGESITEVFILEWTKPVGAYAEEGETVAVLETDKANMDLTAPIAGTVSQVLKEAGDAAAPDEVIGFMEAAERPAGDAAEATATPAEPPAEAPPDAPPEAPTEPSHVMPAAARVAAERGVDPATVEGSGPGGRVLKEDVVKAAEWPPKDLAPTPAPAAPAEPAPAPTPPAKPAPAGPPPVASTTAGRTTEVVQMTRLRKRIASRLVGAQNDLALLTTFNEVDMGAVMAVRTEHKAAFQDKHGTKLGFMSFFVKAAASALQQYRAVNAAIDGDSVVYHNYCDIGVAVGGGKGLVVPVLRNTEAMSFATVEATIRDFGARAQQGKIRLDELQGGTFTISNGGVYGSMLSTPIVNPPQTAILGMHNIVERPVALKGQVVIRPVMYLALSYDHRLIDGREAVSFLKHIKECVEDPTRLLLEV